MIKIITQFKKAHRSKKGNIMLKRTLVIISILFFITTEMIIGKNQDFILKLDDLIVEALENNPDLKAQHNRWKSIEKRISQAGSLPDPVLGLNVMNLPENSFNFNQEAMTGKQISLKQKIPFPGKLGLKQKIAAEEARVVELEYLEKKIQLIKNVKKVYYGLFNIEKAIEINKKNSELLNQFEGIADTRYRTGKGLLQDVLRVQLENSRISEKIILLKQKRSALALQLNALLNRKSISPVGSVETPVELIQIPEFTELKSSAERNRPLILLWQTRIKQSDKKVKFARKSYLPDFTLGVAYTQREVLTNGMGGVDYFSGSINMTLPIYFWKKQKKLIEENYYSESSVQQKFESVQQQVESELKIKLTELEANGKLLKLYKTGILQQASQTLESALSAYQVNRVDFLTVLNSQVTLFNYEMEYFRVLSNYFINIAEIEEIIGGEI